MNKHACELHTNLISLNTANNPEIIKDLFESMNAKILCFSSPSLAIVAIANCYYRTYACSGFGFICQHIIHRLTGQYYAHCAVFGLRGKNI